MGLNIPHDNVLSYHIAFDYVGLQMPVIFFTRMVSVSLQVLEKYSWIDATGEILFTWKIIWVTWELCLGDQFTSLESLRHLHWEVNNFQS